MLRLLPRLVGWCAYGGLLFVGFGLSAYLAFSWFVRSGVTAVPDVRGLAQEQAVALVRDQGLEIAVQQAPRYDEEVPENHVILQDPGAGSLVKRGSVVEIITSLGQELVEVPEVKGQALQAAQVTLHAAGLNLGRSFNIYGSSGRPGTVVTQTPSAGSRVAHSSAVDLFLSLEGREETFLMPDLVYRRFDRIEEYFRRRGFRWGSVKFEAYEGIPAGTILRQHPLPGHRLRKHDVISVVVTTTESRPPKPGAAPRL